MKQVVNCISLSNSICSRNIDSCLLTLSCQKQTISLQISDFLFCRVWNYEEAIPLDAFDNHTLSDRGISKLCLVNELDDSLLLVASCKFIFSFAICKHCSKLFVLYTLFENHHICMLTAGDGNVRIWKDYTQMGKRKLVTAFSSTQGHRPGVRSLHAVVDWQQQSHCLVVLLYAI